GRPGQPRLADVLADPRRLLAGVIQDHVEPQRLPRPHHPAPGQPDLRPRDPRLHDVTCRRPLRRQADFRADLTQLAGAGVGVPGWPDVAGRVPGENAQLERGERALAPRRRVQADLHAGAPPVRLDVVWGDVAGYGVVADVNQHLDPLGVVADEEPAATLLG